MPEGLVLVSLHLLTHSSFPRRPIFYCSCLSWNTYIKTQIASADYDGVITLWDALIGQPVSVFEEHEKRAWSVDFCRMDPTKLISGSDDTKVTITVPSCQCLANAIYLSFSS